MKKEWQKKIKLNLGCGSNKIKGFINIDTEPDCKPDLVLDIINKSLPYKDDTVDEILFFHCIEHIRKPLHRRVLMEMNRVLKPDADLYISYPNFWECAKRWKSNANGQRTFWEATLYGRQLYPADYHVCAIDPDELILLLYECGFKNAISYPEPKESYNTVTTALKNAKGPVPTYETVVARDMQNMRVQRL